MRKEPDEAVHDYPKPKRKLRKEFVPPKGDPLAFKPGTTIPVQPFEKQPTKGPWERIADYVENDLRELVGHTRVASMFLGCLLIMNTVGLLYALYFISKEIATCG